MFTGDSRMRLQAHGSLWIISFLPVLNAMVICVVVCALCVGLALSQRSLRFSPTTSDLGAVAVGGCPAVGPLLDMMSRK